jgi:starvation-inducible outer membrane lipoprotein
VRSFRQMKALIAQLLLCLLLTGCVTSPVREPGPPPFTEIDSFQFWQECGQ